MKKLAGIIINCIVFSFCLCNNVIHSQILKDTASFNLIGKSVDYLYSFQFKKAEEACQKISKSNPGHPVFLLLRGMINYWENYPLIPSSPAQVLYVNDLQSCIQLCEKKYDPENEAEFLMINMCARGMLMMFYSDNDFSNDVFHLATSTYPHVRRSFDFTSVYPDFNFFTGLYNYYREAYPEAHPVYKGLAFLFPKGDMIKGLKELQFASRYSIFLKAESYSFLAWISINFENNYQQASVYSKTLYELYPANIQYQAVYIKNLLLLKQYDEAERLIKSTGTKISNSFFQAQLSIFNGILQEKKYYNPEMAQHYYEKGINDISPFCDFGNEYAAYAYFGLSRISDQNGNMHNKKIYQKKATELAEFKKISFDN